MLSTSDTTGLWEDITPLRHRDGKIIAWNPNTVELIINKNLTVQFEKMPNRWHRFWYRVLLGWTWRKI